MQPRAARAHRRPCTASPTRAPASALRLAAPTRRSSSGQARRARGPARRASRPPLRLSPACAPLHPAMHGGTQPAGPAGAHLLALHSTHVRLTSQGRARAQAEGILKYTHNDPVPGLQPGHAPAGQRHSDRPGAVVAGAKGGHKAQGARAEGLGQGRAPLGGGGPCQTCGSLRGVRSGCAACRVVRCRRYPRTTGAQQADLPGMDARRPAAGGRLLRWQRHHP